MLAIRLAGQLISFTGRQVRAGRLTCSIPSGSAPTSNINKLPLLDIIRRIVRGERVLFVAGPADSATTLLLLTRSPAPAVHIDRLCIGGDGKPTRFPCGITVLGWRPATAPGRSGSGALLPR